MALTTVRFIDQNEAKLSTTWLASVWIAEHEPFQAWEAGISPTEAHLVSVGSKRTRILLREKGTLVGTNGDDYEPWRFLWQPADRVVVPTPQDPLFRLQGVGIAGDDDEQQ